MIDGKVTHDEMQAMREEIREEIIERIQHKMPKNAVASHLGSEGHIHNAAFLKGGGGIVHYDYVVDASYTGAAGATVTMAGGSSAKMYATIQAAITAADADNADRTILINRGTYTETIAIATTFSHDLRLVGESLKTTIINGTFTYSPFPPNLYIEHLTINSDFTFTLLPDTGSCIRAFDCRFLGNFNGSFENSSDGQSFFSHCSFANITGTGIWGSDSVSFENCSFGTLAFTTGGLGGLFSNCEISSISVTGSASFQSGYFDNCEFGGSGGSVSAPDIHINTTGTLFDVALNNCHYQGPQNLSVKVIHVQAVASGSDGFRITDSGFSYNQSAPTSRFIQCDTASLSGWTIVGNRFHHRGPNYIEDDGGVSIQGIFVDSIIGPNSPPDFALQADAGTIGTIYVGTGTVSGAAANSVTVSLPQRGAGAPTHTAPEGTAYWDTTNNNYYVNNNGSTGWTGVGGASVGNLAVELNDASVDTNVTVLDFTEPDGTLVTSSPAGEANVNMALYAKLAGRAGGQTLIGGTATGEFLNFRGNSVDASAISRFLQTSASPSTDMVRGVTTGETGTSTSATTGPPGTMTDTTKTWATSQWVGAVVTSGGKTLTVTSNTSTVLTGSGGWSGGGNPGAAAYSISLTEAFPRWAIGFDAAAQPRLLLGSGFVAPAIEVARGGTNVLNLRFLTAATAAITLRSLASTDTQPRFEVTGGSTGRIAWGIGGSTAVDTALARVIANVVKVGIGTTAGSQPGLELPGPNTPGHIVAPVSLGNRIYSAIFANRTRLFCINDNGIIAGPIGYPEGVLGNVPLCGLGAFGVDANNQVTTPWGCLGGVNHVFNTRSTARTDTGFTQLRLTTNATAGTVAGAITSRAGLDWPIHTELNGSPMLQMRFAIDSSANIRLFIGWTNLTLSQMVWKDEPGDAGTADAAVTYTATTMTDTREAWTVNEWVGAILLNQPFTTSLVVTSNTATTITGTAGWTNGTPAAGSAWSLGQYLGLQYSSGRGDTTWQFVAKEATNTFTRVDTLIGVTGGLTSASIVRITHDTAGSAGAVCELFGPDRVSLGAAVSMLANLAPEAGNDMRTVAAIETRTGATKTIGLEAGQEVIRGAL